jgi:hypothetical protein
MSHEPGKRGVPAAAVPQYGPRIERCRADNGDLSDTGMRRDSHAFAGEHESLRRIGDFVQHVGQTEERARHSGGQQAEVMSTTQPQLGPVTARDRIVGVITVTFVDVRGDGADPPAAYPYEIGRIRPSVGDRDGLPARHTSVLNRLRFVVRMRWLFLVVPYFRLVPANSSDLGDLFLFSVGITSHHGRRSSPRMVFPPRRSRADSATF